MARLFLLSVNANPSHTVVGLRATADASHRVPLFAYSERCRRQASRPDKANGGLRAQFDSS